MSLKHVEPRIPVEAAVVWSGDERRRAAPDGDLNSTSTMPRFVAIDGLRAWMAWLVVACHIVQQALPFGGPSTWVRLDLGGEAVDAFIIISGFVITHLLIERRDSYLAYIIPRFMRLFPAFLVCCAIGGAAYAIGARWADPTWFNLTHGDGYRALTRALPLHILAHGLMLHGAIPNTILPESEYAFLPPGWSVSLEWQFYLLAPFVIWLCQKSGRAFALVLTVVVFSFVYHHDMKTLWERPSILIGTSKFFLIGITCRFAAPSLSGLVQNVAAVGLGLAFTVFWIGSPSVAVWLLIYAFMLRNPEFGAPVDRLYVTTLRCLFESKWIQFLAERSYSTYLLHWPVIMLIGTIATGKGISAGPRLLFAMLSAVPLTFILQEVIYRFVEVPGRALGRKWARAFGAQKIAEIARESIGHGI